MVHAFARVRGSGGTPTLQMCTIAASWFGVCNVDMQTLSTVAAHGRLLQLPCRDHEIHSEILSSGEGCTIFHPMFKTSFFISFAIVCTSQPDILIWLTYVRGIRIDIRCLATKAQWLCRALCLGIFATWIRIG